MTQELILSGADIVKVGIGPGSVVLQEYKLELGILNLVQLWNVQTHWPTWSWCPYHC